MFISSHYKQQLSQIVNHKKYSSSQIELKSKKILANCQFFECHDLALKERFFQSIYKISLIRPGRKLLKALIQFKKIITLSNCEKEEIWETGIDFQEKIRFSLNARLFYQSEENKLAEHPFEATVAHELIHMHNLFVEPEETKRRSKTASQLSSEFHNLEEELTITGMTQGKELAICENAFLYAWKLPLRINHLSLQLSISTDYIFKGIGADHLIFSHKVHEIEEGSLNQICHLKWAEHDVDKNIRSLS